MRPPQFSNALKYWSRVTYIWDRKLTINDSGNGLSADRRQAIFWTNAEILLIGPLGTNLDKILIETHTFFQGNAFEYVVWKMVVISSWPQCVNSESQSFTFELDPQIDDV